MDRIFNRKQGLTKGGTPLVLENYMQITEHFHKQLHTNSQDFVAST